VRSAYEITRTRFNSAEVGPAGRLQRPGHRRRSGARRLPPPDNLSGVLEQVSVIRYVTPLRASDGVNLGVDFLPGSAGFDPAGWDVDPDFASQVLWLDAPTR
jgi:hypothetical protein